MYSINRRDFVRSATGLGIATLAHLSGAGSRLLAAPESAAKRGLRFGLVTYMWGYDWDLPTLLANCKQTGTTGVELRTEHAHGVEPQLTPSQRHEVKQRFADSPITLVGLGCNEDFHDVDSSSLRRSVEQAKEFVKLSHDVGGSGVKVKPNDLPPDVPHERTIERIGKALNELGAFAADFNQQIRLEVHGQCSPLPIIQAIMTIADHPNVAVCWNSNPQDLTGEGLEQNFRLVQDRLGATTHVRQLSGDQYPYPLLISLLKQIDYDGWLLVEANEMPRDRVSALAQERAAFDKLVGV